MSRTFKMLISNWPRTRKFNRLLHLHAGKAIAFDFSHCHALITLYVQFLCSDWSKFDMQKIYAASGNLLTDSWSWQGFVSSCDVFNCLFLLDVASEIDLLTRLFCVIHGWFVYCAFGLEMHSLSQSHWKSDFGWHRFQKWAYPPALTWRVKRGLKSLKPFWPDLMTFRSSISTVKPEQLLSLMCFSFSVSWGRA